MITKIGTEWGQLYHGTGRKLTQLNPRDEHGDPLVPPTVFATPDRKFSLAYTGDKWGDRDIEQNFITSKRNGSRMTLREMRPGAFAEVYGGRKGYLHTVPGDNFKALPGRCTNVEVVSTTTVTPTRTEIIKDALKALQAEPGVTLHPYDASAKETIQAIKRQAKRAKEMSDGGKSYLKWRLGVAPEETKQLFNEVMQCD